MTMYEVLLVVFLYIYTTRRFFSESAVIYLKMYQMLVVVFLYVIIYTTEGLSASQ